METKIVDRFTFRSLESYLGLGQCVLRSLLSSNKFDTVPALYNAQTFVVNKKNLYYVREALKYRVNNCRNCDRLRYQSALDKWNKLFDEYLRNNERIS